MFPARKIAVSILSVLFLSLYIAGAAYAQDVMGCVDPQKIMFQHPKFEQIQKQVRDVTNKKQEEAKAAAAKKVASKATSTKARSTKDAEAVAKPRIKTLVVNAPSKPAAKKSAAKSAPAKRAAKPASRKA